MITPILHAVGTRPNFVKMAPVISGLRAEAPGLPQVIVHTGQHYDATMSDAVLSDVELPRPDHFLGVGSGSHAEQTGKTLIAFERILLDTEPQLVVVAGDVNSTLACALAAAKLEIPVAHVESGLRSFDWSMPEEVNRVLTDRLSELLFTHSPEAADNLRVEGIPEERVHFVGNSMIDTLRAHESVALRHAGWKSLGLDEGGYVLVTLHRPSNVDDPSRLGEIADALCRLQGRIPTVFPLHPRTRSRLEGIGAIERMESVGIRCTPPAGYLEFLSLEIGAGAILTDSGGIQEEASALGVPCFTLRPNTERPVTLSLGTNVLLGDAPGQIGRVELLARPRSPSAIPLWDGHAGQRMARVIAARCAASAGVVEVSGEAVS